MSEMKLTADSGGGSVSVKAPSTTGSNADREFTLPDTYSGNGSLVTADSSGRIGINKSNPSLPFQARTTTTSGDIAEFANSSGYGMIFGQNSETGEAYLRSGTGQDLCFATNSGSGITNERMRIDSGGGILIGSGNQTKTQDGVLIERNTGDGMAHITAGRAGGNYSGLYTYVAGPDGVTKKFTIDNDGTYKFFAQDGSTERMRIKSDGVITTNGNTSVPTGSTSGFGFTEDQFYISGSGSSDNYQIRFYNSNGLVGSCMTSGSSTSYNTSSDYRLKENIISLTGAITRIKELSPKRFNFKANASKTVDGFLAHEAQTVVPEAVSGTKDAVDSDDKIMPQGIDQSKLVPLLTAALQEAIAKIETLETKVAALEAE